MEEFKRRRDTLPRLPVPELKETMKNVIECMKAIVSEAEIRQFEAEVNGFVDNEGKQLQEHLQRRYQTKDNWLTEYWLHAAYLGHREPLSNGKNGMMTFAKMDRMTTDECIKHITCIIQGGVHYLKLCREFAVHRLYEERGSKCTVQYYRLLGTCRVPGKPADTYHITDPGSVKHVLIAYNNNLFTLELFDENGDPFTPNQWYTAIADEFARDTPPGPGIGLLTGMPRDDWATIYAQLENDERTRKSLDDVKNSLQLICLDGDLGRDDDVLDRMDKAELGLRNMYGAKFAKNRWFDKGSSYVLTTDGYASVANEHTLVDGMAAVPLAISVELARAMIADTPLTRHHGQLPRMEKLHFRINDQILDCIATWESKLVAMNQNLSFQCLKFDHFGSAVLKKLSMSPDSFVQLSLQLAYYRLHGKFVSTYESCGTRAFLEGRTENLRTCTPEAVQFVVNFTGPATDKRKALDCLHIAAKAHKLLMTNASDGRGIDRHILGLKMAARELGVEDNEVIRHKVIQELFRFKLSTSQLKAQTEIYTSFAPPEQDGYSASYNPRHGDILLTIGSYLDCPVTDTQAFGEYVFEAMQDIKELLQTGAESSFSKL